MAEGLELSPRAVSGSPGSTEACRLGSGDMDGCITDRSLGGPDWFLSLAGRAGAEYRAISGSPEA